MVGHIRGGLAQVTTVFSMFFSGMSGSSSADVAVLSAHHGRADGARGLQRPPSSASLIAAASTIAALVPPSIMAVVYGAIGNVSIAGLFLGGIVPGRDDRRRAHGLLLLLRPAPGFIRPRATFGTAASPPRARPHCRIVHPDHPAWRHSLTGWFTPTEAGVIAIAYILLIVIPLLKPGAPETMMPRDFVQAGLVFSLPLITIAAASAFGWLLAYLRGPIVVAGWIGDVAGTDPVA